MSQHPNDHDGPTHEAIELRYEEYAENTLGQGERAEVEAHLAACEACAAVYRDLAATAEALGTLKSAAPTRLGTSVEASLRVRSGGRFFAGHADQGVMRWMFQGPGLLFALAVMVAIMAAVYWLSKSPTGTLAPPPPKAPVVMPAESIVPPALN